MIKTAVFVCLVTIAGFSQCTDPASNCNNFDIPITNNTSAINYGVPVYNGTALTDYIINWVDGDGNIAFTSAGGSFYDPVIHEAHPPITDIPLSSGFYEPVLVSSNPSAIVSCKNSVEIVPYECTGEPQTVSYEGTAGGVTRIFEINVPADCDINIDFFDDVLEDNYEIFGVNGATQTLIGSGGDGNQLFTVPSGYTSVIVQVTSDAGANTIWDFTFECCFVDPCEKCDQFQLTFNQTSVDAVCDDACQIYINSDNGVEGCEYSKILTALYYTNYCGVKPILTDNNCHDLDVSVSPSATLTITNGMAVYEFNTAADLTYFQSLVSTLLPNQYILFSTRSFPCGSDGTISQWVINWYNTVSYDFTALTMTVLYEEIRDVGFCDEDCDFSASTHNSYVNGGENGVFGISSVTRVLIRENEKSPLYIINGDIVNSLQTDNYVNYNYGDGSPICGDDGQIAINTKINDINCPCESYEIVADTDDDGIYETLIDAAPNWTGVCQ